jgi:hypothetical protein
MQSNELLAELDALRLRVRARASAGWVPMLLTGLALLGSFPAYAGWFDGPGTACGCFFTSPKTSLAHRLTAGIGELAGGSKPLALYWLTVVPAVYALSCCWFALSRRRTGLAQRWGLHVFVGVGTLVGLVLTLLPPLSEVISQTGARPLLTPLLALALGLVVLGKVEHDRVVAWSGVALGATAATDAALSRHISGLPDSFMGNVGQSLLAPSVEVAGIGLTLMITAIALRGLRRREAILVAPPFVDLT